MHGLPAIHVALEMAARGPRIGPVVLIGFIIAAIALPFFMSRRTAGGLVLAAGFIWMIVGGVAFGMHKWLGMIILLVVVFFTHIVFGGRGGWGGGGCGSCGGAVIVGGCGHGCGHSCSSCGSSCSSCGSGCGGGCGGCGGCS